MTFDRVKVEEVTLRPSMCDILDMMADLFVWPSEEEAEVAVALSVVKIVVSSPMWVRSSLTAAVVGCRPDRIRHLHWQVPSFRASGCLHRTNDSNFLNIHCEGCSCVEMNCSSARRTMRRSSCRSRTEFVCFPLWFEFCRLAEERRSSKC